MQSNAKQCKTRRCKPKQCKAMQSKAERSKAKAKQKQSKAKRSKAKQSKAKQRPERVPLSLAAANGSSAASSLRPPAPTPVPRARSMPAPARRLLGHGARGKRRHGYTFYKPEELRLLAQWVDEGRSATEIASLLGRDLFWAGPFSWSGWSVILDLVVRPRLCSPRNPVRPCWKTRVLSTFR